jgi:hypothetical protein
MWVDPGGGVPPHVHPSMEERFEVLSGELSLLDGRNEEFLTEAAAMAREGKLTRNGLPKTPAAALQAAKLAIRHRKMVLMRWI